MIELKPISERLEIRKVFGIESGTVADVEVSGGRHAQIIRPDQVEFFYLKEHNESWRLIYAELTGSLVKTDDTLSTMLRRSRRMYGIFREDFPSWLDIEATFHLPRH